MTGTGGPAVATGRRTTGAASAARAAGGHRLWLPGPGQWLF